MKTSLLVGAFVGCLMLGPAFGQVAAPAAPAMDKAALSKSCSLQADTKGLHGKARKRFRSQCKRGKS